MTQAAVRKRFDRKLYDECDQRARECTTQYLESVGYQVEPHPDRYAQDLIATMDGYSHMVECEMKLVWEGIDFPYPTVQLPERKKKFFNPPTQFFIWNALGTHAVSFWSSTVEQLEPVEVPNRYVYSGEMFYQVPLTFVEKVQLCE